METPINSPAYQGPVYQGQFGEFTIDQHDRQTVIYYRSGLMVAALSFAIATTLILWQGDRPSIQQITTPLYILFCGGLAVSLWFIHIYMVALHRALQIFWLVGALAAIAIVAYYPQPLTLSLYQHPLLILGAGFTFAALTGLFFKEAFCFNRLETKVLTPLVPLLLLGHLLGFLPLQAERSLLAIWAFLFMVFALRKAFQAIPDDIGDKSVFAYLKNPNLKNPQPQQE
jgi:uncharacterized integral membrane protein